MDCATSSGSSREGLNWLGTQVRWWLSLVCTYNEYVVHRAVPRPHDPAWIQESGKHLPPSRQPLNRSIALLSSALSDESGKRGSIYQINLSSSISLGLFCLSLHCSHLRSLASPFGVGMSQNDGDGGVSAIVSNHDDERRFRL